jgi:hypothetical protein
MGALLPPHLPSSPHSMKPIHRDGKITRRFNLTSDLSPLQSDPARQESPNPNLKRRTWGVPYFPFSALSYPHVPFEHTLPEVNRSVSRYQLSARTKPTMKHTAVAALVVG